MSSVLGKLASALGRRDEVPNQEMAAEIARTGNRAAVQELADGLRNRDKNIQSDCIKTLYEIGERRPGLIAEQVKTFGALLEGKNNRLVWGAMSALDACAEATPADVYALLPQIIRTADAGTVITKDHAVSILAKLSTHAEYTADCLPLLLEQVEKALPNQFPSYTEKALPVLDAAHMPQFIRILADRLPEIEHEPKRRRVEKILKKAQKPR